MAVRTGSQRRLARALTLTHPTPGLRGDNAVAKVRRDAQDLVASYAAHLPFAQQATMLFNGNRILLAYAADGRNAA